MLLSIVIPAYNEENRIGNSLSKIYDYLEKNNYTYEIIVVDDGSADSTVQLLKKYSKEIPYIRVLENKSNRGKGYSVKKGVLESKGDIVLFSDADLSTPIEEMSKLLSWVNKGYPIVIGSRGMSGSQIKIHQAWYRQLMGKIFNKIIRTILNLKYHDTQCGFKCFQRTAALEVFNSLNLYGFSFDIEILYIAKRKGIKVKEVPVCWYNSPESKVRIIQDSLKMLWDVLMMRFNNIKY